jgi:glycosyltransferase involved in cell wall biosynthesis
MKTAAAPGSDPNMTRVLLSTDVFGGAWAPSLELAAALPARGVEVDLVVLGSGLDDEHLVEAGQRGIGSVYSVPGALEWMPEPWADVDRTGRQLMALAAALEPDVVHLGSYAHAALPWSAPTVLSAHAEVVSGWRAVHGVVAPHSWDPYRARVAAGLRAADAIIAPSAATLIELRREYDLGPIGTVIPHGRDAGWVAPRDKQPVVLAVGRMGNAATNLTLLAEATADLPWPLVIAGDAPAPAEAPAHVTYPGQLAPAALEELMLRASIYAAPARYEPFDMGALQAGQAGCALLLGDIPSLREMWGDAAWFVDPTDPAAIAAGLRTLIADDDLRGELGERARERAAGYTPERMAATYLYLYRELAAGRRVAVGAA